MSERRLLLAGSFGPERVPVRNDRDDADWFKPPHIRDEAAARERIAAQVAVGADVVVAPTWLTHRRALLPIGETRRVAEWSAAAVRVARDAVEIGLERRNEALAEADGDDIRRTRPGPMVAASLPALEDGAQPEHGRLLPREAATERDYRDQAGVLADAGPDLILVEGQRREDEARVAMSSAADTGLPVWLSISGECLAGVDLEDWLDRARAVGVSQILVPPPLTAREAAVGGTMPWGGVVVAAGAIADWLAAGAGVIGRLDGATVSQLEPLRDAVDAFEGEVVSKVRAAESRWRETVAGAARMAPGGAAVLVGKRTSDALPSAFAWLTVEPGEVPRLPHGHFRLVVVTEDVAGTERLLDRGGILVQPWHDAVGTAPGLRLLTIDEAPDSPLAVYRRED